MSKTDATWLSYCYIVFAGLCYYVFFKAIETVGIEANLSEATYFELYNNLASVALGVLSSYLLRRDEGRRAYHLSVIGEIKKVRWPTFDATKQLTIIVAIVVAIFAAILFVFDLVWVEVLKFITPN